MEKVQLVYAELVNGIPFSMLGDPLVHIISDSALFVITTLENSLKYEQDFLPVHAEAMKAYQLECRDGRVRGKMH